MPKQIRVIAMLLAVMLLFTCGASAADYEGAREALRNGYQSGAETIDLEQYGLKDADLQEIFTGLRNDNQLPWYAHNYSYSYDAETEIVKIYTPINLDETQYVRALYEMKIQEILAETVFPGMSQWQIALSIHDYLVSHYCYDETYTYYTGYDLLVGGTAVCEGYARAYMDLLKRAGVDAIYATSEEMDHGWNLVKINGNWYHVDVTWDDPISDCYGRVRHFYFLVDDTVISDADHNHYGWVTSQTATSTDMNSGVFWQETDSAICYESASVSYMRKDQSNEHWIYRRDEQTGNLTELAYFDAGYIDIGSGTYHYSNHGLSLWNGRLYFSDMENVYSMNTDGSDRITVYTYDAEANGRYILGSFVDDGVIYLSLADHDGNTIRTEAAVPGYVPHEHSYTLQQVEPTCTQDGYVLHVCSCGDSYQGETLAASGHFYDNGVITVQPTVDSEGTVTYTCRSCADTYTESIPALEPGVTEGTADPTPQGTLPQIIRPQETDPSVIQEDSAADNEVPILPIATGVIVLLLLLNRKKKPRKKQTPPPADRQDPYGSIDPYGNSTGGGYSDSYGNSSSGPYGNSGDTDPYGNPYGADADDYSSNYETFDY